MGKGFWAKPGSPHYRPPSGAGYGGPARGGGDKPAQAFDPEHQPPPEHKSVGHVEQREYRERLRAKLGKVEAAYDDALGDADNRVRLMAAKQIEDRVFGQAKQVVETQEDTRSPDEIKRDIERKRREAGLE